MHSCRRIPSTERAAVDLRVQRCDQRTAAISGELDVGTAPTVGIVLSDPDITDLDLGEITFIDAAGLRVLLTANRQRSARLGLLSVSRPVQRLFELTGHLATFRWATAATVLPDRPDLADPEGQNGF